MKKFGFQIICNDCGCLAVRIEDPIKASREAKVYCGDCGASRGTMGALRDLAVQTNTGVVLPTGSELPSIDGRTTYDLHSGREISEQYGELQRLRQQVKIAESAALRSRRPQPPQTTFA
jgi:hypothetical protein